MAGSSADRRGDPRPHVVVVGSINMDLVAQVPRLPRPGETIVGRSLHTIPGGKGANQAVAAARLGARSTMIGRVGGDGFGHELKQALAAQGVAVDQVAVTEGCSSGVALIAVDQRGENAITLLSGANARLTVDDVTRLEPLIASADALLVQLEVPLETVAAAVRTARRHGVLTILDPAPAPRSELPPSLFEADIFTPNQTEAAQLAAVPVDGPCDAAAAAEKLARRGARTVVIKLGEHGALLRDEAGGCQHVPAARVEVVDSTAAGDAFTAAMAIGFVRHMPPVEAVRFACAAGTLAATRLGAQQSMPTRAEVEQFQAARM